MAMKAISSVRRALNATPAQTKTSEILNNIDVTVNKSEL